VPVLARDGLTGVITVFRDQAGEPERDQLELVTVYAGYAASAIERDRLLDEVTERNRVLETIREVLETLAGPIPVGEGLGLALQSLCRGLQADEVTLLTFRDGIEPRLRGRATGGQQAGSAPEDAVALATAIRSEQAQNGTALHLPGAEGQWHLAVTFAAPGGRGVLLASWSAGPPTSEATVLIEDAAHSFRLALEREQAVFALQEATALRRSQELQRDFLSRLSHELRTPLTAIRGYATSLLQPDVTWDAESQHRFLTRIAAESTRLGRLVEDLLDFSAIELGILRLQPDWCDLKLVLEAAVACLPPDGAAMVEIWCAPNLPAIWADHDRLEQVFVNLLGNAVEHNPPGTPVTVRARPTSQTSVAVAVIDEGVGLPADVAAAPFEPRRRSRARTAGAGLGLSIARGIVAAHGGLLRVVPGEAGASFEVRLPVEDGSVMSSAGTHAAGSRGPGSSVAGLPGARLAGQGRFSSIPQPTNPGPRPPKEAGRS
jgi:signal transduction histidine kinase